MAVCKRFSGHIEGEQDAGLHQFFNAEVFVPFVGAVEADAFGILLGLGELEEVAEAEAAPGGSGGPALLALHARVLGFLGEAAEVGEGEGLGLIDEALDSELVRRGVEGEVVQPRP